MRQQGRLTIEELAEASGVSVRAIGDMERGRSRVPQRRTVAALAEALRLTGTERGELLATARVGFATTRSHDLPADLTDRLTAAGFVAEDSETVLIGRSADLAADPALPDGVTLRRVTARSDLERIAAMESAVRGEDWSWLADDLAARIESAPENIVVLVAEARAEVVCAAWLVFKDGVDFGGLWGGSALEE